MRFKKVKYPYKEKDTDWESEMIFEINKDHMCVIRTLITEKSKENICYISTNVLIRFCNNDNYEKIRSYISLQSPDIVSAKLLAQETRDWIRQRVESGQIKIAD